MFSRIPAPGFVDPFKTETQSKEKADPAKALQKVVSSASLAGDLMRGDREVVARSLAAFERAYPDSPTRRLRAQSINETLGVIRGRFRAEPPSAAFHREAIKIFKKCTWLPDLIAFLKRLPLQYPLAVKPHAVFPQVINIPHIIDGDENGGFHLCPPGHPRRRELQNVYVNPRTGVMIAQVDDDKKSFFPLQTPDQVVSVLTTGRVVAKEGNCTLFTSNTNPSFPFETRTNREGADIMSTAFPLIHYSRLRQGVTIDLVTGLAITPDEILRRRAAHREGATRLFAYQDDPSQPPREIYEIAPLIHELPTGTRGAYLDVATGFLPDPAPTGIAIPDFTYLLPDAADPVPIGIPHPIPTGPAAPPHIGQSLASMESDDDSPDLTAPTPRPLAGPTGPAAPEPIEPPSIDSDDDDVRGFRPVRRPPTGAPGPMLLFNAAAPPPGPTGMQIQVLDDDDS